MAPERAENARDAADSSGGPLDGDRPIRAVIWQRGGSRIAGGHQVQFEETARALRAIGISVELAYGEDFSPDGFDVVHGSGLPAEVVHDLRERGFPVVISTIYWDLSIAEIWEHPLTLRGVLGRCRRALQFSRAAFRGAAPLTATALAYTEVPRRQAAAFEAADLLLPNAEGEAASVRRELGVTTPSAVVPNAVDPALFDQAGVPWEERDIVLNVARIDPEKNQLGLIEALRGTGRRLVQVGGDHPDHPKYAEACRKAGEGWVEFRGRISVEELQALFAQARVHILPSWFETTGLASLEAALSGCSLVSTERGHAAEYLGHYARYCDPSDPASIRSAIDQAWANRPDPALRQRVLDRYTWSHTAEATAAAYRTVLAARQ